ncbi:MAG: ankyrin repeat domain-containing protein [Candidatus Babeliales bacterium]
MICLLLLLAVSNLAHSMERAFLDTAKTGDVALIKPFLGNVDINYKNGHDHTALVLALDHKEAVQTLLEAGALVDQFGTFGLPPLQWAIRKITLTSHNKWYPEIEKRMEVARLLLARDADFSLQTDSAVGDTVFHKCFRVVPQGPSGLAIGLHILSELIFAIFSTQGPLKNVTAEQQEALIPETEAKAFQSRVWEAVIKRNKWGQTCFDLICFKSCPPSKHGKHCPLSNIEESTISKIYSLVLQEKKKSAEKKEISE